MPVQYLIDKRHGLVITSAWDLVTFAEYKVHQDQLTADPDFDSTFNHLLDSTKVTAIKLSTFEIKTITSRSVFSSTSKRAVVAPNPAYFGVARMAEAYHSMTKSPSQVRVFHDLSSALKWLDLQSDVRMPTVGEITRWRECRCEPLSASVSLFFKIDETSRFTHHRVNERNGLFSTVVHPRRISPRRQSG